MGIIYQIPSWLQRLIPHTLWRGDKQQHTVFLTFDDGPVPEVTPQVLDLLDQYDAKATFFQVGENVYRYPELAQEVLRRGHQIGNHTFNHLSGWHTSSDVYRHNCGLCAEQLRRVLGAAWQDAHLFRPPHGRMRPSQKRYLLRQGYRIVLWDVITHDYNTRYYTPDDIVRIVQRYTRNGSIILFHDSKKSAPNTLEALPRVLTWLREQGYTFATLG